jgi:deoxyribonuclease-4
VPHNSYLINIAAPDDRTREKSLVALIDETTRAARLGLTMVNFHPGSHRGELSDGEGIARIAEGMNRVLAVTSGVSLVLEGTAGSGYNLGHRFEHLAAIIELVDDKTRVGVCLDTCHLYAAGYDIRSLAGWRSTIRRLESIVGLEYLRAMHLNDSMGSFGSRRDRHESIGYGRLGISTFKTILRDPRLHGVPLILETTRPSRWPAEVRLLRAFADPRLAPSRCRRPRVPGDRNQNATAATRRRRRTVASPGRA